MACRILVLQSGIEPEPLQWKQGVLTTGPTENSLLRPFLYESQKDDFFVFWVLILSLENKITTTNTQRVCLCCVFLEHDQKMFLFLVVVVSFTSISFTFLLYFCIYFSFYCILYSQEICVYKNHVDILFLPLLDS